MNFLLDLIIVAIIGLSALAGYKKGLIKVAFKLLSFILAIVISIMIYKPISDFIINRTPIDDTIEATIAERLNASDTTSEEINNFVSNYFSNIKNASTAVIADTISNTIINVAVIIIVFIIANIILILFKFIGDLIGKLPLLKEVNNIGGLLYGILRGFVIIYILFAVLSIISPLANINGLLTLINKSIIANIMYNNNIIFMILK